MLDGAGGKRAAAGEKMGDGFAQDRLDRARRVAEFGARLADRQVARGERDAHALGGAVRRPARDVSDDVSSMMPDSSAILPGTTTGNCRRPLIADIIRRIWPSLTQSPPRM